MLSHWNFLRLLGRGLYFEAPVKFDMGNIEVEDQVPPSVFQAHVSCLLVLPLSVQAFHSCSSVKLSVDGEHSWIANAVTLAARAARLQAAAVRWCANKKLADPKRVVLISAKGSTRTQTGIRSDNTATARLFMAGATEAT